MSPSKPLHWKPGGPSTPQSCGTGCRLSAMSLVDSAPLQDTVEPHPGLRDGRGDAIALDRCGREVARVTLALVRPGDDPAGDPAEVEVQGVLDGLAVKRVREHTPSFTTRRAGDGVLG